jgi:ribosome maturation factor RimP
MKDLIAVSEIEKILLNYLNPIFLDSKYEIIRIKVYETKNKIIQIMIDHSNKIIDIEDCAKYSRMISEFLDKKKFNIS